MTNQTECIQDIESAIKAYQGGERRPGVLASDALGGTRLLISTAQRVNQLNSDKDVVFSDASLEKRIGPAADFGTFAVGSAATVVGAGQLAIAGAGQLAQSAGVARLQALTDAANANLAANPGLAQNILSPGEYQIGQNSVGIARMEYGNAMERMVANNISESPINNMLFEHVGGPNNPDFIGKGILGGMNFDITTPGQIASHLARPYGQGLNILTYVRPPGFLTFP